MKQHHGDLSVPVAEGGRMLFLIDEMSSITAGGTERQLLQMIHIARACGWTPQICVLRRSAWFSDEIAGCPVKRLDWDNLVSVQSAGHGFRTARWLRKERFDVMQTIFPESNLIGPWLAKLAGIPVVLGTRRNLSPGAGSRLGVRVLLQRVTNHLTTAILVNSEAVLRRTRQLERTAVRKLFVIHNGIDLKLMASPPGLREQMRRELGLQEGELLVGNLSGLRPVKGIDIFVDAAVVAHRSCPQMRFVIVGEGELRAEVEALIERVGLKGICMVAGPAMDVRPYLAAMDIAVLCSKAEGFSNSLLEYMAAGLATVATDVGGNREALGGSGLLIAPNDPQALARAIVSLLDSRHREVLGLAARQAVQQFDLPAAEAKTADIYRRLLTPRRTQRSTSSHSSSHSDVKRAASDPQTLFLPNTPDHAYRTKLQMIDHKESR